MGLGDILRRIFLGKDASPSSGHAHVNPYAQRPDSTSDAPVRDRPSRDLHELSQRLGMDAGELAACPIEYSVFRIPKRSGGTREISAPSASLKTFQRIVLRRLLARLKVHPAAEGFEHGRSIVTNARRHVGRSVVLHMDIQDFFGRTAERRVRDYFRGIGWDKQAAALLTRLCTHGGALPQGAPTSPRLSNLVNYVLDTRLDALAARMGAAYTRYADDLTFSFEADRPGAVGSVIRAVKTILDEYGYRLHTRRKLHVRREHDRQVVTGLVVNRKVQLPRPTRRRLRAVRHHLATDRTATLTPAQLAGWDALQSMIRTQADAQS